MGVGDDKSEVEMTFSVGTYRGGKDIIEDEPMGGNSAKISRVRMFLFDVGYGTAVLPIGAPWQAVWYGQS